MQTYIKDFPAYPVPTLNFNSGMSLRVYAAIQLRVPDSGLPWIDDMIRESNRTSPAQPRDV